MRTTISVVLICLLPILATAAARSSSDYTIECDTLNAGGGAVSSGTYSVVGALGEIGGISTAGSLQILSGFAGQLEDASAPKINEAPADLELSKAAVRENQSVGTVVGSFSANDPDLGDTHVYTLVSGDGDTDNGSFAIDGSNLKTAAVFDLQIKNSYSIRVRVTDSSDNTYEEQFIISVTPPAAGDLDFTFNSSGMATTAIGTSDELGYSVAVQSDGKIVVAGYASNGSNNDFALARYKPDGSLDETFGIGGKVTTAIGSGNDAGYSVAVQQDGKIVVAGYSHNGSNNDFALARYQPDGSLDETFGTGGKVTTAIGTNFDLAYSLAVQSDGKIVVAGYTVINFNNDFALARYHSDGSLDEGFGTAGKVITAIGASEDTGYSVAVQQDGKIVVAGRSWNGSNYDFALVRYHSDGSLDGGFGTAAKVTAAIGTGNDEGLSVAALSDGKILVAGYSHNGSNNNDFALARFTSDGSLDTTFNTTGKVTTSIGPGIDQGRSLAVQSDGRIVVAGSSFNGSNHDFALVRYHSDGSIDEGFGMMGKMTTAVGSGADVGYSVAVQNDGRIVVAGYSHNGSDYDFALARYEGDPTPAEINLVGNSNNIANGDATPSADDHTDFGSVQANGGSVSRTFTIENKGFANLNLLGDPKIALSGDGASHFSVTAEPASPVGGSGSTTFTIEFAPTAAGTHAATVSIANNDIDEDPYAFAIQGTGANPDVTISQQPTSKSVVAGGNATFSVTAEGEGALTYQWQKDGSNLAGKTSATLTLENIQTADAGNYRVIVSNSTGSVTSATAILTVMGTPVIVVGPQNRSVVAGASATFSVQAEGSDLTYQWYHGETAIEGRTSDTLVMNDVQESNAGIYRVVVRNPAGSAEASATLSLLADPLVTWASRSSGTSDYLLSVAWSGSQFVAAGGNGRIVASPDGIDWTSRSSGTTLWRSSLAWSGSRFVAGGLSRFLTSADGLGWTLSAGSYQELYGITWGGSQFVAVGYSGEILTSPDGITWTSRTSGTSQSLWSVAWSGSQFVAAGDSGTILNSADGISWASRTSGTSQSLRAVAWGAGQFVAAGSGGVIVTSADGVSWTGRSSGVTTWLRGITWSGSHFVVVGHSGKILTSADGISWTSRSSGTGEHLYAVASDGGRYVVVGDHGTILQAGSGPATPPARISGNVQYYSGNRAVPGVTMTLSGDDQGSMITGADGAFSFEVAVGGACSVFASDLPESSPSQGVTTLDIALIRRDILGIAKLDSAFKVLAADVNGTDSVTTLDIALIRRLILGVASGFPSGLWKFVPSNVEFSDPLNPWGFSNKRDYTGLSSEQAGQDFIGIKLGDVNSSWTPPATVLSDAASGSKARLSQMSARARPAVTFRAGAALWDGAATVPIIVSGFENVSGLQFTLQWDPEVLEFGGVSNFGLAGLDRGSFGYAQLGAGRLTVSWDDPEGRGVSVPDGTVLWNVHFSTLAGNSRSSTVSFTDSPTPREVSVNAAAANFSGLGTTVVVPAAAGQLARTRIQNAERLANGTIRLQILIGVAGNYEVETSTDLTSWTTLNRITEFGLIEFIDTSAPKDAHRFYRLVTRQGSVRVGK